MKKILNNLLSFSKKEYNLFVKNKKLKNNKNYFSIDPMPNDIELENYYKNIYKRNDNDDFRNKIVDERSILHFNIIEKMNLNFTNFLNIGSNTGGISHLFRAKGKNIYNFDYYKVKQYYDEKWNFVLNLEDIEAKIDFVYLSHSLEHFIDIKKLFLNLNKIIHKNSYVFIEVPNGVNKKAGGLKKIIAPHLHYFKKEFFQHLNENLIKLFLTNKKKTDDIEEHNIEDKNYKFILYLGKGKFN